MSDEMPCEKCGVDSDNLFWIKSGDSWWCVKCYEATGETTSCFSCVDKDE